MVREDAEDPIDVLFRGLTAARVRSTYRHNDPTASMRIRIRQDLLPILREGAKGRNLTDVAYARRASLAFAAYDLGLDFDALTRDQWTRPRYTTEPRARIQPENEIEGVGLWKIRSLG